MKLAHALLAILLAGCATKPITPTDHTQTLLTPITAAQTHNASAKDHLTQKNYMATGQDIDATAKDLTTAATAAHEVGTIDLKTQQQLADRQAFEKAHQNDWFGARAHRLAWELAIGGLVLGIGLGCLKFFAGASPITGVIFHGLAAVASGGVSLVMHGVNWLLGKIVGLFKRKTN